MNVMQLTIEHQRWLKALQEEAAAGHRQAYSINDGSRAPTPSELAALTQLYRNQYDGLLFRYGSSADHFAGHELTGLRELLHSELCDLQSALSVLAQIEAERRRHEAERWVVQQQADEYAQRLRSQAHGDQMRAHEEHNRRWSAAFNQRSGFCSFCARPLTCWGSCGFCFYR